MSKTTSKRRAWDPKILYVSVVEEVSDFPEGISTTSNMVDINDPTYTVISSPCADPAIPVHIY